MQPVDVGEHPGEHRRHAHGEVREDVDGGGQFAAVCRVGERAQRPEGAEEGGAPAAAEDRRGRQEQRGRAEAQREQHQGESGEQPEQPEHGGAQRLGAAEHQLGGGGGAGQQRDGGPADEVVGGFQQREGQVRAEREVEAADRPDGDDDQDEHREPAAGARGHVDPVRDHPEAAARPGSALPHPDHAHQGHGERADQQEVAQDGRRGRELDEQSGPDPAQPDAHGRPGTVDLGAERGLGGGTEFQQGRAHRPGGQAHGEPLHRAGGEQQPEALGPGEQAHRDDRQDQAGAQDGAPAEGVGEGPEQQQSGEHGDGVQGEDHRDGPGGQAPLLLVEHVEGGGHGGREHQQDEDRTHHPESGASGCAGRVRGWVHGYPRGRLRCVGHCFGQLP